jgi:hypothetical protein
MGGQVCFTQGARQGHGLGPQPPRQGDPFGFVLRPVSLVLSPFTGMLDIVFRLLGFAGGALFRGLGITFEVECDAAVPASILDSLREREVALTLDEAENVATLARFEVRPAALF